MRLLWIVDISFFVHNFGIQHMIIIKVENAFNFQKHHECSRFKLWCSQVYDIIKYPAFWKWGNHIPLSYIAWWAFKKFAFNRKHFRRVGPFWLEAMLHMRTKHRFSEMSRIIAVYYLLLMCNLLFLLFEYLISNQFSRWIDRTSTSYIITVHTALFVNNHFE